MRKNEKEVGFSALVPERLAALDQLSVVYRCLYCIDKVLVMTSALKQMNLIGFDDRSQQRLGMSMDLCQFGAYTD